MMNNRRNKDKRERASKRKLEDVPLTPMIDVVFQMLIYFVVTFEIPDRLTEMKVWRPQGENTNNEAPENPPDNITIYNVRPGASPYTLNERGVSLASIRNYVFRLADNNPEQTVVIKATYDSKHKHLVELLNLMSEAGLENISLFSAQ